ncbi:MAG: FMN-binding protein [bacterium]
MMKKILIPAGVISFIITVTVIIIAIYTVPADNNQIANIQPTSTQTQKVPTITPIPATSIPLTQGNGTTVITPTPTIIPSPTPSGKYKDGTYTGTAYTHRYGTVQIQAVITNSKISDVVFLKLPSGGESSSISSYVSPILKQDTIQSQSANVNVISGATLTSNAFIKSLSSALSQAI